jgi:magnesium transporter
MNQGDLVEALRQSLEQEPPVLPSSLLELRDPDIADVLNQLSVVEAAHTLKHLPLPLALRLYDHPEVRRRSMLLEQYEPEQAAPIIESLSSDERTYVLRKMSPHECHRLLPKLNKDVRTEAEQLLKYPPNTAGGIMTTEFVSLEPSMTVGRAIEHIRKVAADSESIYACYVLEPASDHLLGAVSLRDLIMADPGAPVTAIMRKWPITVAARDPQQRVAEKISKYNLLAVPVLEEDGRVVGFVTVDDVIDVMVEEETERVLRMGGVEPGALDLPYLSTSFGTMVRKRASWLVILFLGEMLTATAMGYFEDEIA